jgi:hypothetical protein
LFRGRHFADDIIVLCVRWYLCFSLSCRDREEIITVQNLAVDHTTAPQVIVGTVGLLGYPSSYRSSPPSFGNRGRGLLLNPRTRRAKHRYPYSYLTPRTEDPRLSNIPET